MTAIYYQGSGSFSIGDSVVRPPEAGEVRLEVAYCGLCGTDLHIAHGAMDARIPTPMVIGHEMSGIVAEVGAGVTGVRPSDRVVVRPLDTRDSSPADRGFSHIGKKLKFIGIDSPGALQASWTVPSLTVHLLPPSLDLRLAALSEPLAVACHDVRRSELASGETAVVLGGGPIGLLIALVARERGARVLVVEPDDVRRALARELGLEAFDPHDDLESAIGEVGAEVVFEVSGSAPGILAATKLAAIRGRVIVVAIFPEPKPVALFDLFWKELDVRGARVYEPQDFEAAIELLAAGSLEVERLISAVEPIERVPAVFDELRDGRQVMKILVDCRS